MKISLTRWILLGIIVDDKGSANNRKKTQKHLKQTKQ